MTAASLILAQYAGLSAIARQPLLLWGGTGMFALAIIFAALGFLNPKTVTGVNAWIKPMKFAVSIGIYYWTVAFLLQYLPTAPGVPVIAAGTFVLLVFELALITLQAARGVRSHFNNTTAFDGVVFSFMGLTIVAAMALAAWLAWLFVTEPSNLPAAYLLGIRLGLVLFIVASLEGFVMVALLSHSVGIPDGGPGLPFFNWSTKGGDLRVAHFLGMHALQILPLASYILADHVEEPLASRGVIGVAILMAALTIGLFSQALRGRPVIHV